jgi:hypothetical protein
MARGGHGLAKVSLGLTMSDLSTPCGRASPEMALWLFQGWHAHRTGGLWLFSMPLDTPYSTPMDFSKRKTFSMSQFSKSKKALRRAEQFMKKIEEQHNKMIKKTQGPPKKNSSSRIKMVEQKMEKGIS